MSVRFRIRTPGGQELSFASVEMFEDFVRSGDLSPDDIVYDAEDGSWAPARTHPIVLNIQYEEELAEESGGEASDPAAADADSVDMPAGAAVSDSGDEPGGGDAFGLSLAPAKDPPETDDEEADVSADRDASDSDGEPEETPSFGLDLAMVEEVSADEARQQFLEKMEAERADDFGLGSDDGFSGFQMETSGSLADLVVPEPAPPPPPPPPSRPAPPARPARPERSTRGADRPSGPPPPRPKPSGGGGGGSKVLMGIVALGVLGGGGFLGLRFMASEAEEEAPVPEVPVEAIPVQAEPEPGPAPEPVIASTESAVRERARERFLTATQAAFRDLPPIPATWPGGAYLSMPSAHAEVLSTWEVYLTTVRQVRADDDERFATAYESALDDAVIEGEERATRLDAALVDFETSAEARNAHYDRVEALASAAIQSHNALLGAEGLLIFDGTGDGVAPGPIGAGVSARDDDSALLLEQVGELLSAVLDAEGLGPGTGENVRAWVWDGFLGAVTN